MISYDEALSLIAEHTPTLDVTARKLKHLLGYVTAGPVIAPFDVPRFANSAMDGYGVAVADLALATPDVPVELLVQAMVQAGDTGELVLKPGHSIRIYTGAPIPQGVEAVVMQEFCTEADGQIQVTRPVEAGENIRCQGEEFQADTEVLPAGVAITPPVVGLLASLGYKRFPVYNKPTVALIVTGNELVKPGRSLKPGQIYDSNAYALQAALQALGIEKSKVYHVADDREATLSVFNKALSRYDVVISLGGVSVGDFDYVTDVVESAGVQKVFWKLAIKPGKPVYFGYRDSDNGKRKLVFGLPGNPVSAMVTFHQLVRAALQQMMGLPASQQSPLSAVLEAPLRKKAGRLEFVRGSLTRDNGTWHVIPTPGQESHMMGGLAQADCLIVMDSALESKAPGESVAVIPFSW